MIVHLLTTEQAEFIKDKEYINGVFFNPVLDFYDRYVITIKEASECINEECMFVKNTEIIEFIPKERKP